jgi:5-methylcytosine-specific restriction endonuclease McrA
MNSKVLRRDMFAAQRKKCHWCGRTMRLLDNKPYVDPPLDQATIDHVIPRTRGGTNERSNLVLACLDCNRKHANTLPAEREYVSRYCSAGLIRRIA